MVILAMLMIGLIQPVGAQRDYASCGHFETQADAQAALDDNPELATTLDSDNDGIACEELTTGGPVVVDPVSCGFFETQEDAQFALDENPDLATTLDSDGDGIACEELETGGAAVVVCAEATGNLIEVSQSALDQGSLDFPYHRATEAEIAAGTCEATVPVTPGAEAEPDKDADSDDDAGSNEVLALPKTGAGAADEQGRQGPLLAAMLTLLVLTMGAIGLRSRLQRAQA